MLAGELCWQRVISVNLACSKPHNGLTRKHVHAVHAKLARRLLLGCRAKTIEPGDDVHVFQVNPLQIRNELCLRQSAGDSSSPDTDGAADVFREGCLDRDVGEV